MKSHLIRIALGVSAMVLSLSTLPAASNQPPTARFTAGPAVGIVGTTFTVDASLSTDDKTPASKLKVRWDWENDGTWDTALTTVKTATHQYSNEGVKTVKMEVRDAQNLAGTTTQSVNVEPTLARFPIAEPQPFGAPELDIDVDPADPQRLVVASYTRSTDETPIVPYPAFYSTDGGASWGWSTGPYPAHPGDPGLEFDSSGRLFLTTIDLVTTDGNSKGVKVSRSTDGGQTFTTASYAMDSATPFTLPDGSVGTACDPDSYFDYPRLAVDRGAGSPYRDNLYVVAMAIWLDSNGDGICDSAPAVLIRSRDAGQTWDAGKTLPGIGQIPDRIGIAPDGTLYIADGGYGTPFCPSGIGIALRRSTDGGASFLPPTCALPSDVSFITTGVNAAVDPRNSNKIFIAFSAASNVQGSASHIYLIRSIDAGATWSAPARIDDVLPADEVDHIKPSLSVSTTGRLDVAWMDYRFSSPKLLTADYQPGDVYYSYSLDGGATWAPNVRLSAATSPLLFSPGNDYLTVVSSGSKAHAAYSMDLDRDSYYEAILTTLTFH
jgi:hypothetical protein